MPSEEEQQHQPGTDEQPAHNPPASAGKCGEPEQNPTVNARREDNESDRSDAANEEIQRGPETGSPVKGETRPEESLQVERKTASSVEAEKDPTAKAGLEKVSSGTVQVADEEDDDDEDDEEDAGDNDEQEDRGGSRDGFHNEEEQAGQNAHEHHHHHHHQHDNRQDQSQTPTGGPYYEDDEEDDDDEGEERSELRQLFEPINDSQAQSEDEEDGDYIPDEEVKKTIMVGSDFQAVIPEGLCRYDDALPYENEDKLLWNPTILNEPEIVDYLLKITSPTGTTLAAAATTPPAATGGTGATGGGGAGAGGAVGTQQQKVSPAGGDPQTNSVYAIPLGNHLRDDEQSLYLLQQCGHNIDEALRRRRISNNAVPVPEQQMSIWSEEECRNFENGLRVHGKDFHMIQQTKVRTRSVGELVQFYYLWKKTERHDLFASKARLEKKKYNLHPGLTDHMDRFLEEQENSTGFGDRSSSPGFSTLYSSASEAKRQRLLDSKENNNTASSKRSASNL